MYLEIIYKITIYDYIQCVKNFNIFDVLNNPVLVKCTPELINQGLNRNIKAKVK